MSSEKPKNPVQEYSNFEDAWVEDFAIYLEDGASFVSVDAGLFHPQAQSSVTYRMK